jgi:hypothetical protein
MHAYYLLFCLLKLGTMISSSKALKKVLDIKKASFFKEARGDKWTRTTDSRIFSPMLYQLSYITV